MNNPTSDRSNSSSSCVKPSVAVIIATFNEAESIGAVVAALPRDFIDRIIVVDGGSSDATRERAQAEGAQVIAVGRGYGLACLAGFSVLGSYLGLQPAHD